MSKVVRDITTSLDGFIARPSDDELIEHIVRSGPSYAPDRHCALRVFGIGRLSFFISMALILWGLRIVTSQSQGG
jgi:hypothetical protein